MFRRQRQQGIISDFSKEIFDEHHSFARVGGGSLGGKARGLGFINSLINNYNIYDRFENIHISVPSALIIGTDVFDAFMDENNLNDFALQTDDDELIIKRFREASFPHDISYRLVEFLEIMNFNQSTFIEWI